MSIEIERKFLVKSEAWKKTVCTSLPMRQGYFPGLNGCTIRVRIIGNRGYLTIKGHTGVISRSEYEYEIPVPDAVHMLDEFCDPHQIVKTRHLAPADCGMWEIDVFEGDNAGLIIAEIELDTEESVFERPDWLGEEVSFDPAYRNQALLANPYKNWKEKK